MNLTVALAGNPNSGKTTLFNRLTGTRQTTGNWPGVTVEKKTGLVHGTHGAVRVVDLPGIYSLSPYSLEEVITRNYIVHDLPDVVIDVIDATNLERNLYLALQLKKLGRPLVIALNMMDEIRSHGDQLDDLELSRLLGVPVVPISARNGDGIDALVKVARSFTAEVDQQISDTAMPFASSAQAAHGADLAAELLIERFTPETDAETEAMYHEAAAIHDRVLVHSHAPGALSRSDRIDRVLTNRFLAIPIFLVVMLAGFQLTFHEKLGGRLTTLLDEFFSGPFSDWLRLFLDATASPAWISSLLIDGVVAGVGGILAFLPQILLLFLFLTILEDSGYMARAAFIVDRIFQKFGLSGRSFIPMLMGFGCTVPAVMAARSLESERDRRLTIMITPFMSCGARMPIYAFFASVFFTANKGLVTFSMYLIGVLVAVLAAFVLSRTVLKGQESSFVIELPPYRLPDAKSLFFHVYDRVRDFVIRAGTIIFAMTLVVWVMQTYSFSLRAVTDNADSMIGTIGGLVAPLLRPLGFGTYQSAAALLTGLIAKESVVATMGVLYTPAEFAAAFTPLSAYAFMVFTLLYTPCLAAIGAIHHEMNSTRWTLATLGFQTGTAYAAALLVYQSTRLRYLLPYLIVGLMGLFAIRILIRTFRRSGSSCACSTVGQEEGSGAGQSSAPCSSCEGCNGCVGKSVRFVPAVQPECSPVQKPPVHP